MPTRWIAIPATGSCSCDSLVCQAWLDSRRQVPIAAIRLHTACSDPACAVQALVERNAHLSSTRWVSARLPGFVLKHAHRLQHLKPARAHTCTDLHA